MKKFNGSDFIEYVRGLDKNGNPFDCPKLRILPEDVVNFDEDCMYKKGMLVCTSLSNWGEGYWYSRCRLLKKDSNNPKEFISLNENGELEIECEQGCGKFKLKVQGFEYKP